MQLVELAKLVRAEVVWPEGEPQAELSISRIAPIAEAQGGELTFISNPEYAKHLATTKASAVIVASAVVGCKIPQLVHRNPYWAFAKLATFFHREPRGFTGVSEQAYVAPDAVIGKDVTVYPHCYVGPGVKLGARVTLHAGVSIGADCIIGDDVTIYANAVLYHGTKLGARVIVHGGAVIGSDGFGFAPGEGEIAKIPQVGHVEIEEDVEVGALATIDRAAMGVTQIKRGTKLDSKVHVGHNVEVGEHCMLSAFTGISGSAKIGNWVLMGGHSGINGHITIADKTKVGAMTGVVKDTEAGETYMGFPALPASQWRRQQVYFGRLADYDKRLRELEAKLAAKDA